jgi:signal transduction histidine kinase
VASYVAANTPSVGLGQIDANGTLTALNAEFARLFDLPGDKAQVIASPPAPLAQCWHDLVKSPPGSPPLKRWLVTVGSQRTRRSLEVVGWASAGSDGRPVVELIASERPPESDADTLSGTAERARLAREIHDGLAQDLWLAKLTASKLAHHPTLDAEARALCDDLLRSLDAGLAEARTAVMAMRPDAEPTVTLTELVERRVEEFADRFGVRVDCKLEEGTLVPARVSLEILRILQEALNNVRKHAHARRTAVTLEYRQGSVALSVRDDGEGFDPAIAASGYGRQSMQERADSIGARLTVASRPGRGTTVTLRVPRRVLESGR